MKNIPLPFLLGSLLLLTACDPQNIGNQASSLGNLGSDFSDLLSTNGTLLANDCGNGLIGLETTTGQLLGFLVPDLNGTPSNFVLPGNLTCESPNALTNNLTIIPPPLSQLPSVDVISTPEPRVIGGLVLLSMGGIVSLVSRSSILGRNQKSTHLKP